MKTVEIIKGVYGYRAGAGKSVKPVYKGNTVGLHDIEADRLVRIGVAKYVAASEMSNTAAETPRGDAAENVGGKITPDGENGSNEQNDGTERTSADRPEYSSDTKLEELRVLMEEVGLQYRVGMKKSDMVAALDAFYDSTDDEDDTDGSTDDEDDTDDSTDDRATPPDLQPDAPVP